MNKTDKAEQQAIDEADRRMRQAYRTVANKICGHKYVPRETMEDAVTDPRTVAGEYPEATVENALSEIKRLIGWLEYVREDEYSDTERQRIISISIQFAKVAQPIASKYND